MSRDYVANFRNASQQAAQRAQAAAQAAAERRRNAELSRVDRELERIKRDENRREAAERARIDALAGKIDAANRATDAKLRDQANRISQSIKDTQRQLTSQINAQARKTEEAIAQARKESAEQYGRLRDEIATVNRTLSDGITDLSNRLNAEVTSIRSDIKDINTTLDGIVESNKDRYNAAQIYLNNARVLLDDAKTYNRTHTGIESEAFDRVDVQIANAESDAQKGPDNSSVFFTSARSAMQAALQLQLESVKGEREWELRYRSTLESLNSLLENIAQNETLNVDVAGDGIKNEVDVDHWSYGALSSIKEELEKIRDNRLANTESLSMSSLENIMNAITIRTGDVDRAIEFAPAAMLEGQIRVDICDDAKNCLEENGFTFLPIGDDDSIDYRDGDDRKPCRVHLRHGATGLECYVTASPIYRNGELLTEYSIQFINCGSIGNAEKAGEIEESLRRRIVDALSNGGFIAEGAETSRTANDEDIRIVSDNDFSSPAASPTPAVSPVVTPIPQSDASPAPAGN